MNMKEKEKIIKSMEFVWSRNDKKVSWELTGDDLSKRMHVVLNGTESRQSDTTVSVSIPTSIASWKEILQQMVR